MIKKFETIQIEGTVLYCDGENCGRRGPQAPYENVDDVLEQAEKLGWSQDEKDNDLCPDCLKRDNKAKVKVKKR